MNKLAVLMAAFSLAITLVARADESEPKPKKDKSVQQAERLKKYDTNGDGKLDADEKKAMREDLQKQKDKKPKKEKSQ